MFDYSFNGLVMEGFLIYPDFVFPSLPKPPEQIHEGIILKGTAVGGTLYGAGSVDREE